MFCRKCGKQILDDSKFCQYCGESIPVSDANIIEQTIVLKKDDIQRKGTTSISFDNYSNVVEIQVPSNTQDGQVFRLSKAIMTERNSDKKVKKDVYIKIKIT